MARLRSSEQLAEYVDEVGIAVVWGKADLVLPSAWRGIAGSDADWAVRDDHGKAVEFSPDFRRLWRWKDELPKRKRTCAGRHFGSAALLIAPRLLAAAHTATAEAREEQSPLEREIAAAVDEHGPLSAPELRDVLGTADKKPVDRAIARLQKTLVLTNAGVIERDQGWPAIQHDLLVRRWRKWLRRTPTVDAARSELAATVLRAAGEVSAADIAGALGWRRKGAAQVLDELPEAERSDGEDFALWRYTRPPRRGSSVGRAHG